MHSNFIDQVKKSNLGQAWLVLLLTIFFGGSLAGVQIKLGPVIEQNKINETLEKVPELIMGKALAEKMAAQQQLTDIRPMRVAVDYEGRQIVYSAYETRYQGKMLGWVVKTAGRGYADTIELLLGLDPTISRITGLYILDQKETPGLGNKILEEKWRNQFIGKSVNNPVLVVKTGAKGEGEINAISGATISSSSVTQIINTATSQLRPVLAADTGPAQIKNDREKTSGPEINSDKE
ncbi:FMN-binding protein [Desulfobacterales bacterium HSG16]|nr:FMN-binding protein [Desulfobacterales bacterium HSG16]